jgi:hypothetical protein
MIWPDLRTLYTVLDSGERQVPYSTAQAGALRCCLHKSLQARPSKTYLLAGEVGCEVALRSLGSDCLADHAQVLEIVQSKALYHVLKQLVCQGIQMCSTHGC